MNEKKNVFKAWITKHALTSGIQEIEATLCSDTDPTGNMIEKEVHPGEMSTYFHSKGRDWHETLEGAIAYADKMRDKKIAALKKQIAKLVWMKF